MSELANDFGLHHLGDSRISEADRPRVPLFSDWERTDHRISGVYDGVRVEMFDLTRVHPGGESTTTTRWTVILFRDTPLPSFFAVPKTFATAAQRAVQPSLSFDEAACDSSTRPGVTTFNRTYELTLIAPSENGASVSSEDEVRAFFVAPRLEAMAQSPNWYIQSADGCLVFALKSIAPPERRSELLRNAIELRRRLLAPIGSARVIPAARGMDHQRQSYRKSRAVTGAIAGGVLGFFGTFFVFVLGMMTSFSRPDSRSNLTWLVGLFPFIGFGGLVAGGWLGFLVGGRLADRKYPRD